VYTPAAFREERLDVLHDVMRRHSFATLVTSDGQAPFATHVPVLLDAGRGRFGTLRTHLARPNPQWQHFSDGRPVLVAFQGPHAYVSPSWYASGAAAASGVAAVPTWNYVAVHAYGVPRLIDGDAELRQLLVDTVRAYESGMAHPWAMQLPEETVRNLMRGIVGFEIPIDRLEGKAKLGQNRSEADRQGAIAGLRTTGDPGGADTAELMERALKAPAGSATH
jgi:transcriptional regulator